MKYNKLEVSTDLLNAGFSIYVLEIKQLKRQTNYYIGMTGDNYYPSARGAFFRIAGHLEKLSQSTQNQMHKALVKLGFIDTNNIYKEGLSVTMHHFPIEGFLPWNKPSSQKFTTEYMRKIKMTEAYAKYKKEFNSVINSEKYFIYTFSKILGKQLLNKSFGKYTKENTVVELEEIENKIRNIINEN